MSGSKVLWLLWSKGTQAIPKERKFVECLTVCSLLSSSLLLSFRPCSKSLLFLVRCSDSFKEAISLTRDSFSWKSTQVKITALLFFFCKYVFHFAKKFCTKHNFLDLVTFPLAAGFGDNCGQASFEIEMSRTCCSLVLSPSMWASELIRESIVVCFCCSSIFNNFVSIFIDLTSLSKFSTLKSWRKENNQSSWPPQAAENSDKIREDTKGTKSEMTQKGQGWTCRFEHVKR